MLRFADFCLAVLGLLLCWPLLLVILFGGVLDTGSPLFFQARVGRHLRIFTLVKFRTMSPGTASVATHLADGGAITRFGRFLRHTKLDELPQLWNVLTGDMSLVGPRPCLPNQTELIQKRRELRVFDARPGITGLAQIHAIDMSTPDLLAATDAQMLGNLTLMSYMKYLFMTILGKGTGDRIKTKNGT
jgi:O-antigen biosynthesis protein WbqP